MNCTNFSKEFLDSLEFRLINSLDRIIENNNLDSFESEDLVDVREYLFESYEYFGKTKVRKLEKV